MLTSKPIRAVPGTQRSGGFALLALVLLALAFSLFVLPFLRAIDAPDWDAPDPSRKTEYASEDDEGVLDVPFDEDVGDFDAVAAEEEWGLEGTLADLVAASSEERYGWDSEGLRASELFAFQRLAPGRKSYVAQCAGCHGLEGDGGGPAATHLAPRPRNFRRGLFKFKSTELGGRPKPEDLLDTITRGLVGSAMPDFRLLPLEKRWDIVEYVRYLAIRGEFEQSLLDIAWQDEELPDPAEVAEIVERRWAPERLSPVYPSGPETERDAASVERGRVLFNLTTGASCYSCHGAGGLGDGASADAFDDAWGYPIRPRDLTTGVFRGGSEGGVLWRVIAEGIQGTPMPGARGTATSDDIWDMVHFVQHLAEGGDL